jgi:LAO/AO transport system kinase
MVRHGELDRRRIARAAAEIEAIAVAHVRDRITAVHGSAALSASAARVVTGETDPYTAASDLVAALAN